MNTTSDVDAPSVALGHRATTVIDPRHNGPRRSANGGYASGRFATFVDGPAKVVLRAPVPLGKRLTIEPHGAAGALVTRGRKVIAEVLPAAALEPHVPPLIPTLEQAEAASRLHPFADVRYALDSCFVCSPHRRDGLRVTPGPLADGVNGALYRTSPGSLVPPELIWAALDCVSYPAARAAAGQLCLLGTLAVTHHRPIAGGEPLAAVGWSRASGNRSTSTSSALVDADGAVVASADAIWVALRRGLIRKGTFT